MTTFIVRERSDGRGGIKPFNTYSKKQSGAEVRIGDHVYHATKDGRVNIPKHIMQEYGVKGTDGRLRIGIQFSTKAGVDGYKHVSAVVKKPPASLKDAKQGTPQRRFRERGRTVLNPSDFAEHNWSP